VGYKFGILGRELMNIKRRREKDDIPNEELQEVVIGSEGTFMSDGGTKSRPRGRGGKGVYSRKGEAVQSLKSILSAIDKERGLFLDFLGGTKALGNEEEVISGGGEKGGHTVAAPRGGGGRV